MDTTDQTPSQQAKHRRSRYQREKTLILLTLLLILTAWLIGHFRADTDVLQVAYEVLPGAERIEQQGSLYIAYNAAQEIIGYAAAGEASGYGGPVRVLVGMDLSGNITGVQVYENRETPGFFRLVQGSGYLDQFAGKDFRASLRPGDDLDAVSGATVSSEAIAASARQAVREIADSGLHKDVPAEQRRITFGIPEFTLLALFAAAYFSRRLKKPKHKTAARKLTLWIGLIVLGFIYTAPLTIAQIIALLSGYLPDWQGNLYWYFLIGGTLWFSATESNNLYCAYFCPFGAFQEILASVSGAKAYRPRELRPFLTWLPRILALAAVLLGLVLRQPGVAGYEPFATLFDLRGTLLEWILLGLTILASLLLYRPFCTYLCPIDPVTSIIAASRRVLQEAWKQKRKSA